jgi:hypothetical protein
MKTIVTVICLLCIQGLSAQRSSVDFIIGGEYSFRILPQENSDPVIAAILASREQETGKYNFRMGLNYNQRLAKNIWLKSGFRIARVGYVTQNQTDLRWPSEFDPSTGEWTPDPNLPREFQEMTDYIWLEVPLIGRWEWSDGKWRPYLEAGLSPHFYLLTRNKEQTDISISVGVERDQTDELRLFSLVGSFALGVNYQINERWQLFGQPTLRYHFTPLMDDRPIDEHLYNYGIELGTRWMFGID